MKDSSHRRRILVLQSEGSAAADVAKSLEDAGYEVAGIALSGEEALAAASPRIDLFFTDISIRGNMDGIETAALLRERFGTPVVYFSSRGDPKTLERAAQTRPLAFLLKPLKTAQWLSALQAALGRLDQEQEFRQHLQQELNTFATLLESGSDFIAMLSADGEVLFLNPAGRRLVGMEHRPLSGTHLSDYILDGEGNFATETILPAAVRDGCWEGKTRLKHWTTGAAVPVRQSVYFVSAAASQGLGLSTQLAGAPGVGSCLWLMARPEGRAEPATADAFMPVPAVRKKSERILVAEDHPVNLDLLAGVLGELGYTADCVTDGLAAVNALQSTRYDLVLMDCEMPVMDGFEATRRIRNPATGTLNPRVPIIAVTASAMAGDRETCIQAGMDDYLVKPVEPDSLDRALSKWLHRSPAERAPLSAPVEGTVCGSAVFDHAALLNRLRGNRALAQNVLSSFLEVVPGQLVNLRRTLEDHDLHAARAEAHSLKGAAANISAPVLCSLAQQAERAAAAGEWANLDAILYQLEDQFGRLKRAISGLRYSIADIQYAFAS